MPVVKEGKCEECHLRHGIVPKLLLKKEGNELCFTCHTKEKIGMNRSKVHTALKTGKCTTLPQPACIPGEPPSEGGRERGLLPVPQEGELREESGPQGRQAGRMQGLPLLPQLRREQPADQGGDAPLPLLPRSRERRLSRRPTGITRWKPPPAPPATTPIRQRSRNC